MQAHSCHLITSQQFNFLCTSKTLNYLYGVKDNYRTHIYKSRNQRLRIQTHLKSKGSKPRTKRRKQEWNQKHHLQYINGPIYSSLQEPLGDIFLKHELNCLTKYTQMLHLRNLNPTQLRRRTTATLPIIRYQIRKYGTVRTQNLRIQLQNQRPTMFSLQIQPHIKNPSSIFTLLHNIA